MIQQIKRILFTSDLSEASIQVFEQTVVLAYQAGASITMLHVIDSGTSENEKRMIHLIDPDIYEKIKHEGQETAKNLLIGKQKSLPIIQNALKELSDRTSDKICDPDNPVIIDDIHVVYGYPAEKILEVAETSGCDLIAMGYHQRGSILRALAGRAEKGVMKKSKIPLFLVPLES